MIHSSMTSLRVPATFSSPGTIEPIRITRRRESPLTTSSGQVADKVVKSSFFKTST